MYFKRWLADRILYVKDLVSDTGHYKSDTELFNVIRNKIDIIKEIYIDSFRSIESNLYWSPTAGFINKIKVSL